MFNYLGFIIIVICSFIQFIILNRIHNEKSKLKDENEYWNERIDFYMNDNNRLERYNFELLSENITLKKKLNDIKDKELEK